MSGAQMFSVNASKEAFQILSSNLYANPRLAVIRELSTNANDSHRATNVKRPFWLHLPLAKERYFKIRDYGSGIPEDLVYTIYTSYFSSTKVQDENQTGYFGLGSKTPFALVDEYKVISYCDGKKKTYLMKKIDGMPTVKKIAEEDSDETGLEIYFDCAGLGSSKYGMEEDFYDWHSLAYDFFSKCAFYPENNFMEYLDENETNLALRREFYLSDNIEIQKSYYSTATINVAGVNFPINLEEIKTIGRDMADLLRRAGVNKINILAKKDDVTVAPSRENLHYDEKTINFISNKILSIVNEYYSKLSEVADSIPFFKAKEIIHGNEYDLDLNEKLKERMSRLLFEKAFLVLGTRTSTKVFPIDVTRTHMNSKVKKVFLVDFDGIKSATKQNVVDNFLNLSAFDKNGKIKSTAFTRILKQIADIDDCLIVFVKDYKNKNLFKECESYIPEASYVKWANYCETSSTGTSASSSTGTSASRKRGFKTLSTIIATTAWDRKKCDGSSVDLGSGETGVICYMSEINNAPDLLQILDSLGENYRLVIRPCTENMFAKYHEQGFPSLKEYVDKAVEKHKDKIVKSLTIKKKIAALENVNLWRYIKEIEDVINLSEFDVLLKDESFKTLRELYNEKTYQEHLANRMTSAFNDLKLDEVPEYKISFDSYPLFGYLNLNPNKPGVWKEFFEYAVYCQNNGKVKQ